MALDAELSAMEPDISTQVSVNVSTAREGKALADTARYTVMGTPPVDDSDELTEVTAIDDSATDDAPDMDHNTLEDIVVDTLADTISGALGFTFEEKELSILSNGADGGRSLTVT